MQSHHKKLALWRKWFNRSKAFNAQDLREMEDHLWVKMEDLMEKEHLTEDQAFLKAVESFGKKSDLIEVSTFIKQEELRKRRAYVLQFFLTLFILCSVYFFYRGFTLEKDIIDPSIPYGLPYYGEIIRPFGWNEHPMYKKNMFHEGVDIQAPVGAYIRSTADGIVREAGFKRAYGEAIVIRHCDMYTTLYAHCSELLVSEGDKVLRGQIIAKAGRTGMVLVPQIHYEVIKYGSPIDPIQHNEELRQQYLNQNSGVTEE